MKEINVKPKDKILIKSYAAELHVSVDRRGFFIYRTIAKTEESK